MIHLIHTIFDPYLKFRLVHFCSIESDLQVMYLNLALRMVQQNAITHSQNHIEQVISENVFYLFTEYSFIH